MKKKMMSAGGNMKKKMMSAGGTMKKKGYAAGGAMKKKMMSAGGNMKKKMMSKGGKMPMNPATGKPTFVGDGIGKMAKGGMKKGYAAGGAMMKKKKVTASRGALAVSDYDITRAKMPGSRKSTKNVSTKKKAPVVTKARLDKLGMTLRQFRNAYKINAAGTGYVKRKTALKPKAPSKATSKKRTPTMSKVNPKLDFGTKPRSGTTVKPKAGKKGAKFGGDPFGLVTLGSNLFGEARDKRLARDRRKLALRKLEEEKRRR